MSVVDGLSSGCVNPELAGTRAVVIGAHGECGRAMAQALAQHRARLVLAGPPDAFDAEEAHARHCRQATGLMCLGMPLSTPAEALTAAQQVLAVFSGADVAVTVVTLTRETMARAIAADRVEDLVADALAIAAEVVKVAVNRMALTWTRGLVLTVLDVPAELSARELLIARLIKAALAAMTRRQAEAAADKSVRVNTIAPELSDGGRCGEASHNRPEAAAALMLHLAAQHGRGLTGLTFEIDACVDALTI